MNSNKRVKVAVGVFAVATTLGLAASGAFTAGGVTTTGLDQNVSGFVGGNVEQTIRGANVSAVAYDLDADGLQIIAVHITTDAPAGKQVELIFTGTGTNATGWACIEQGGLNVGKFDCTPNDTQTVDAGHLTITVR